MCRRWRAACGARLINRNSRQSHLTEAGTLYWQHCRTLLSQLRQVEDEAGALGRLPRGRLRLTAAPDFGAMELEPAVLEFMTRYPDISIDLELTSRFVDLMKEEFDLAIRLTDVPSTAMRSSHGASPAPGWCSAQRRTT